jgi:hypothetical protein
LTGGGGWLDPRVGGAVGAGGVGVGARHGTSTVIYPVKDVARTRRRTARSSTAGPGRGERSSTWGGGTPIATATDADGNSSGSSGHREGGAGPDDDGGVELVGTGHPRDQPVAGERLGGPRRLARARLDQQVAARRQPLPRRGGHPPLVARANTNTASGAASPWLFPGYRPGQPLHRSYLMTQIRDAGVHLLGGRNSALRQLVLDMPPAVAARALGYSPQVAEAHARNAGTTWVAYAAHRSSRSSSRTPI